ncbi:ER protein Pkr1-domain-containing protein [Fimicolochytrium jonesii]|uniref:ER protein Pkr1-domain-containing protein n=1 Tax=Fimicolochytrium jonesii TaxID=1396493 RepID=UPI0022FE764B|nr:ER protein Pkr1-domain-containing protein [Fimicolochytrium jonesii]KAI8823526.1 ER protein Pkr1-domain-containing protein [Fimicolochytrium jonesii]
MMGTTGTTSSHPVPEQTNPTLTPASASGSTVDDQEDAFSERLSNVDTDSESIVVVERKPLHQIDLDEPLPLDLGTPIGVSLAKLAKDFEVATKGDALAEESCDDKENVNSGLAALPINIEKPITQSTSRDVPTDAPRDVGEKDEQASDVPTPQTSIKEAASTVPSSAVVPIAHPTTPSSATEENEASIAPAATSDAPSEQEYTAREEFEAENTLRQRSVAQQAKEPIGEFEASHETDSSPQHFKQEANKDVEDYDTIEQEMAADLAESKTHVVHDAPERTLDEQRQARNKNILEEVWDSIFTPGINSRVQGVMNLSFAGLFLSLLALAVATGGNLHVLALMGVAACLFASIQWFLHELAKQPPPPALQADKTVIPSIEVLRATPTTEESEPFALQSEDISGGQ